MKAIQGRPKAGSSRRESSSGGWRGGRVRAAARNRVGAPEPPGSLGEAG